LLPWLTGNSPFPAVNRALRSPNGLLAAGGDLSPERLLDAYSRGIFPWFSETDPILWWSPDPRMVLFPDELKISRSLAKTLRNKAYDVRVDTAFRSVIEACSQAPRKGQAGTWINPQMIGAYTRLHELGHVHSFETWIDGQLMGGLYGVAIGGVFFGESMFAWATDASKIAFVHLARQLQAWHFGMIDCQMSTPHLATLGAREVPRREFSARLAELVKLPDRIGTWRLSMDMKAAPPTLPE
jgi:leucyl/phenylalanyl-tRNA---protein transferase